MEKLVALAKRRGFFYPGSELYGGVANTYDYGPMGTELLRNIKNLWWQEFVHKRQDIVGLDASLISHPKIWEASGHTAGFADALIDCKSCKTRMRADHLIENYLERNDVHKTHGSEKISDSLISKIFETKKVEGLSTEQLNELITLLRISCPECGQTEWTTVRKFNLLFPVHLGIVEGDQDLAYLRGETAQGMFINFQNIINSTRVRLPFGIAQLGKSFRNEITPGNSVFRTLEFEQGEIEYFFDPESSNWELLFENWKRVMWDFATKTLGILPENLRWRVHTDEERSFYSRRTEDLEYKFPFGYKELWGLAYRTDYDLKRHSEYSQKDLSIIDPQTNKRIVPHVIEPAVGINRLLLMVLADSYKEVEKRTVLSLSPKIAPVKAAVFPLLANKPELIQKAEDVYALIREAVQGLVLWDDRGNIGKRYLTQDEIGTPFCITIDFETLTDNSVTIRHRDSTTQERIAIDNLPSYLAERV